VARPRPAGVPRRRDAAPLVDPASTSATLRLLADARATGAVDVVDPAGGTLFLLDGAVTYAEADVTPGLGHRLAHAEAIARAAAAGPGAPAGAGRAERRPSPAEGARLAEQVGDDELVALIRSAVLDAAVALLAGEGPAGRPPRFHAGVSHWACGRLRIPVDTLLADAAAGVDALARAAIGPDDAAEMRAIAPGGRVVLDPGVRQVLAAFRPGDTPRRVAWRSGASVLDTTAALAALAAQHAAEVTRPEPRPAPAAPPPPAAAPAPAPATPPPPPPPAPAPPAAEPEAQDERASTADGLPRRSPRAVPVTPRRRAGASEAVMPADFASPDSALVARLLDGLRRVRPS
jgi:hypothetical protein